MNVIVHFGEPFWRTVGKREVEVSLASGATVADAFAVLVKRYPALAAELDNTEAKPALFVSDQEAGLTSPLTEGSKVHVVWPVSGG